MKQKLLLLVLAAALTGTAWAQSADSTNTPPANPPPPPGGPPSGEYTHGGFSKILTPQEQQELKTAHAAAFKANPDLATQEKDLMAKMKAAHDAGEPPDSALKAEMIALHKKINAAMIQADPNVAPILAKLDTEIKKHHHHFVVQPPPQPQGQPSPPLSSSTNSAPSGN